MSEYQSVRKKRLRIERIILVGIIIYIIIKLFQSLFGTKETLENNNESIYTEKIFAGLNENFQIEAIPDTTISMAVIGDIMCHNTQYQDAYSNGSYDFSYVFDDIKSKIENADVAIGNLETTFAGNDVGYSTYPTFNTPDALATDLKELGIDVVSTTNNHSLDKGYIGLERTINILDNAGIKHTGTFASQESADQIVTIDAKGIKIGFLAYSYGTNGMAIPTGKGYCINLISKEKISADLAKAKTMGLDLIVVQIHWGEEYQSTPNDEQREYADFIFQNGADIILGSHPHVLQKMEKREVVLSTGEKKQGFIIYSSGNFVSGQVKPNTRQSVILNINIIKSGKNGSISIGAVDYTPIYTFKGDHYKILDIQNVLNNYNNGDTSYSSETINILKRELEQIKIRVGDPISSN